MSRSTLHNLILLTILLSVLTRTSTAQGTRLSLRTRVKLEADSPVDCWASVVELQSCIEGIILFFHNGNTSHLGPGCCRAIRVIGEQCWPPLFVLLGFTTQEINVLQAICQSVFGNFSPMSPPLPLPPLMSHSPQDDRPSPSPPPAVP